MPADLSVIGDAVDPVLLLAVLATGSAKVEAKVGELVRYSRRSGKSWTEIGRGLGVSKQAAWERYSGGD